MLLLHGNNDKAIPFRYFFIANERFITLDFQYPHFNALTRIICEIITEILMLDHDVNAMLKAQLRGF